MTASSATAMLFVVTGSSAFALEVALPSEAYNINLKKEHRFINKPKQTNGTSNETFAA